MTKQNVIIDKVKGTTTVSLFIDNETFTGVAKCHPDDMKYFSETAGESIAKGRAIIKALKFAKKVFKSELKVFENFYKEISQSKFFNEKDFIAKKLRREIYIYKDSIIELEEYAKDVRDMIAFDNYMRDRIHSQMIQESTSKDCGCESCDCNQ